MKKYFIVASTMLFIITGSAFVIHNQKQPAEVVTQEWFIFNGATGQENDPSKYQLVPMEPDCPEGTKRCAVFAQRQTSSSPVLPNLSQPYDIFTKP